MSHAKLLEYIPETDRLLLRAGVGWKPGVVGTYQVTTDLRTPIGYSFSLIDPVAVGNYTEQSKWEYPALLRDHSCVSSLNVPLLAEAGIVGVLEVDHIEPKNFTEDDVSFLTGLASVVGQSIRLRRAIDETERGLEEKNFLLREMNHRIKNNLSLVSSMLMLAARRSPSDQVRETLRDSVSRINNIALVHDRLQLATGLSTQVPAGEHFGSLALLLGTLMPPGVVLTTNCIGSIQGGQLEAMTLIVNELVTNSAKYAFSGRNEGNISIGYRVEGVAWHLWVHDNGIGKSDVSKESFGHHLLGILAGRLNAELTVTVDQGTRVDLYGGIAPPKVR
jgi:two-component sensor histidine kinase